LLKISNARFHFTFPERQNKTKMEDMKKRKMDEGSNNGSGETSTTQDYLRSLLDPLNKSQLVDLLSRLYVPLFLSLLPFLLMVYWVFFSGFFSFFWIILCFSSVAGYLTHIWVCFVKNE